MTDEVNPAEVEINLTEEESQNNSSHIQENRASVSSSNSALKMSQQESPSLKKDDVFEGAGNDFGTSDAQAPAKHEIHSGFNNDGSNQFEKHFLFRPFCVNIRRVISFCGAIAGLLNQTLDIVYAYKIQYVIKMVYIITCLFLILRFIFTITIGQYYYHTYVRNYKTGLGRAGEEKTIKEENIDDEDVEVDEKGKKATSRREIENENHGQTLYACLHLLYYTGFYRVLPSFDFNQELKAGFNMELFLSLLPMFFCQIFNNAASEGELSVFQKCALILKFISLVLMIIELSMMIWENRQNNIMTELGISNLKKLSEEDRRKKYSRQMSIVSFVAMGVFMVLLITCFSSEQDRMCGDRQALEAAVCIDCLDKNCMDCEGNSVFCRQCEVGYVLSYDGQCVDCDDQEFIQCEVCSIKDDGLQTECSECAIGHRLEDGKCQLCDELLTCNTCTNEICLDCSSGFRLENGECVACTDTLHHCDECTTGESCEVCNENIAALSSSGKCDRCQYGWTEASDKSQQNCECNEFVNTLDSYKCQTCFELIPDCSVCEVVEDPGDSFAVEIGFDSILSQSSGKYLVCKEAILGAGMIQNNEDGTFASCSDLFPGCKRCNEEGNQCEECEDRHQRTGQNQCQSCEVWSQEWLSHVCTTCDPQLGCTGCENGYWLLGNGCWKSYW